MSPWWFKDPEELEMRIDYGSKILTPPPAVSIASMIDEGGGKAPSFEGETIDSVDGKPLLRAKPGPDGVLIWVVE